MAAELKYTRQVRNEMDTERGEPAEPLPPLHQRGKQRCGWESLEEMSQSDSFL